MNTLCKEENSFNWPLSTYHLKHVKNNDVLAQVLHEAASNIW